MYHTKHNLFFDRLSDGSVRVMQKEPSRSSPTFDVNLDIDTWASVVATVSRHGETGERVSAAREFHEGV